MGMSITYAYKHNYYRLLATHARAQQVPLKFRALMVLDDQTANIGQVTEVARADNCVAPLNFCSAGNNLMFCNKFK